MDWRLMGRLGLAAGFFATAAVGQEAGTPKPVPMTGFTLERWAREPMLADPVALSFADSGRLYLVETSRRSTVDIDIRAHQSWIVDDLANQSIDDLRRFFRTRMAPEKSLENASWLRDLNGDGSHDWRDMLPVKERVRWLEARHVTGKADRSEVFFEGFNEEVSGVIAGVMPWDRDVWVTVYPDLWRLRDSDGDGKADQVTSEFRGFGVHAAFDGHDIHGLTIGPEGKIYFSHGDNGFSVTNHEGRSLHFPNTGGILRMNPDGSDLEVFASGLRNPQEIAFDDFGNWFSVDNDGDLADERERFVHVAEGSDSGWRLHWQFRDPGWSAFTHQPDYNPWIAEKLWVPQFAGQPAHITPPLTNYSVGPAGFKYNPGTALNDAYRGFFFLAQFPVQKITAFQARPKGASFEMIQDHLFLSGMMASAMNFGPDGAMYIADWDGMWAPNGTGSIWVMDDPKAAGSAVRSEVKRLLNAGFLGRAEEELVTLLGHADQRIRLRAQFELVRQGALTRLLHVAQSSQAPRLARIHALWGLGQGRAKPDPGHLPWRDSDPELRAQSAKLAGDLRLRSAGSALRRLLKDDEARVRYHAGLALGKVGDPAAVGGLISALQANADADAFLRHGLVMGLTGCATAPELAALHRHPSEAVRVAAVLALRRQGAAEVGVFLSDASDRVRRETVRAIHDDRSIPGAIPALALLLDDDRVLTDEAVTRRVLSANLRQGSEAAARRLLRYALNASHPEALRVESVECLAGWSQRPYLDRVEGLVRVLGDRDAALGDRLLQENFRALLTGAGGPMTRAATKVAMANRLKVDPAIFAGWADSTNQPPGVRVQALELLATQRFPDLENTLKRALGSDSIPVRLAAAGIAATNLTGLFKTYLQDHFGPLPVREEQVLVRLAGGVPGPDTWRWLKPRVEALADGTLSPELTLDVLSGARLRDEPEARSRLATYAARPGADQPLAKYQAVLAGGDPMAGREIFRSHPNAQCVRCHDAGGEGLQAGPVLNGIAKRLSTEYLLESLVEPSRQIAPGFATLFVELAGGEEVSGTRVRETEQELTLRTATGETRQLDKRSIKNQSAAGQSAMPPMGEILSLEELRHVLAYLKTLN